MHTSWCTLLMLCSYFSSYWQDAQPLYVPVSVSSHQITHMVDPVYPEKARDRAITGVVTLQVFVGADGTVTRANVVKGPEELQIAALDAVKQWTYRPYEMQGRAVPFETTAVVGFSGKAGSIRPPKLVNLPALRPEDVWGRHLTGTVSIEITVGADGKAKSLVGISGPSDLQKLAIAGLKKCAYTPATVDGVPVEGKFVFSFTSK